MNPTLFTARHNECRRPLWVDSRTTRLDEMFVCGAPTLPGQTHCAECRLRLRVVRVKPSTPTDERAAGDPPRAVVPA